MARPITGRSVDVRANVAERIEWELEQHGWSMRKLDRKMKDLGCKSDVYKILKEGRKIDVDEMRVLGLIFKVSTDELMQPLHDVKLKGAEAGRKRSVGQLAKILSGYLMLTNDLVQLYHLSAGFEPADDYISGSDPVNGYEMQRLVAEIASKTAEGSPVRLEFDALDGPVLRFDPVKPDQGGALLDPGDQINDGLREVLGLIQFWASHYAATAVAGQKKGIGHDK